MAIVHKTFQVRGFLSRRGYVRLDTVLRRCATLYNAGLEEWREAYRMTGVSLGYVDQFKGLPLFEARIPSGMRSTPEWAGVSCAGWTGPVWG